MRINVSAQESFFKHQNYPHFEMLLAAAAVGIMSVDMLEQDEVMDLQVNPVVMARAIGQYIFYPSRPKGRMAAFTVPTKGHSTVTLEVDHIDEQVQGAVSEQVFCEVAVSLLQACFPGGVVKHPNCWSKLHGSNAGDTGWCDETFEEQQAQEVRTAVEVFVHGTIDASEMHSRVVDALCQDNTD